MPRPLAESIVVEVDERYAEQPSEHDDAFAIEHGQIDLAPMVREHVLLAVDDPRLCRPDCPGLCPVCGADLSAGPCRCDSAVVDERWAALDQLAPYRLSPVRAGRDDIEGVGPVAWASPNFVPETHDGRSQEEEVEVEEPQPSRRRLEARRPGAQRVPTLRRGEDPAHGVPVVRLVQEPRRRRRRLTSSHSMLPIAVDAMGGDHAPDVVLAGVRRAVDDGIPVVLVGPPDLAHDSDIELISASELIAMDEEPGAAVRTKKDSTLVRAAEAVRDGKASAMVSAGNTGATMAAALLAHGPHQGGQAPGDRHADPGARRDDARRCSSTPAPTPRCSRTGSCSSPRWAASTPAPASTSPSPRVGLLSIGEEPGKGDSLRKEAYPLLVAAAAINFIGNIEGRDVMSDTVDVAVTDGFTGNVTLKTLEGGMKALIAALLAAFAEDGYKEHADALLPALRAAVQHAQPRHLRRRRPARSRRRVHHLPRLVRGDGDPQRHRRRRRDGRARHGRRDPSRRLIVVRRR